MAWSLPYPPKKPHLLPSRTKLCTYNLWNRCPCGADGTQCSFAHTLSQLQLPEERMGDWSEVWTRGDVDISLWDDYTPNLDSLARFKRQFRWEYHHRDQQGIPCWAWAHAVRAKVIMPPQVPHWIPSDFNLPRLQRIWRDLKVGANQRPSPREPQAYS